jgi:DNA-binding NtrC family response regulator
MQAARRAIASLAEKPGVHVTLIGETGTGKAAVARLIHQTTCPDEPFISVSCAAIPESMFEEELWGATAAGGLGSEATQGLLARAGSGSLFLDEIIAVPDALQAKLLDLLNTRRYGSADAPRELKARVISAAETNLAGAAGFSGALCELLTTHTITLPPLRERRCDVEPLAAYFLERFAARHPGAPRWLTKSAASTLLKHQWPGNVRELQAVVYHSAAICQSPELGSNIVQAVLANRTSPAHSGSGTRKATSFRGSLPELERVAILQAFRASGNNISEAARLVGLPRSTVRDKLKRYGIR